MIFRKPRAVRPGDTVAVVAPAGPFERTVFEAGLAFVAERYRMTYEPGIFTRHRYLAGDDTRRLAELNAALADPAIRAIFSARGGYGVMRLLARLPKLMPLPAKPIIGFSDMTALHLWSQAQSMVSIHAPVLTQFGRQPPAIHRRLFELLESTRPAAPLHGTVTVVPGQAEGPLLGGNLSVFTRLLGTPFMPELEGAVLLLEDVGESPYRLDRMWTHLQLAGVFGKVRAIVLGSFTGCEDRNEAYTGTEVLHDLAIATGLPCAAGFAIGHGEINEPVPLGIRVSLDANLRTLTFLEGAVTEERD